MVLVCFCLFAVPTEAPPLHPISIKNARTTVLYCLKSHASTSQLLAMPCTSIAPTLPEVLQRGPSAELWDNLKKHDTGNLVLALSTDEGMNNNNITHLCVWRDGMFWLHTLGLPESRNGATSTAGNDMADELHHGDNEVGSKLKITVYFLLILFHNCILRCKGVASSWSCSMLCIWPGFFTSKSGEYVKYSPAS